MKKYIKMYSYEIVSAVLCLLLGMFSGYGIENGSSDWYTSLKQPSMNPPAWVFGPVWTVLYLMMGWAFGILWRDKVKNRNLIALFIVQFALNLLWSSTFFRWHRLDLALLDSVMLWVCLMVFLVLSIKQRQVFWLMLPYAAWASFAMFLSFKLYSLNF